MKKYYHIHGLLLLFAIANLSIIDLNAQSINVEISQIILEKGILSEYIIDDSSIVISQTESLFGETKQRIIDTLNLDGLQIKKIQSMLKTLNAASLDTLYGNGLIDGIIWEFHFNGIYNITLVDYKHEELTKFVNGINEMIIEKSLRIILLK